MLLSQLQMQAAILSYNHPNLTARCIESCLGHFAPQDIHLLHNGSLSTHSSDLTQKFAHINHIYLSDNIGYAGGANHLLRQAFSQTDWVLFLSNDCTLTNYPRNFDPPHPGLYAPLVWRRDSGQVDSCGGFFQRHNCDLEHIKKPGLDLSHKGQFYVPGSGFLIHRIAFEKTNGFDPNFFTYWEDVDFSLKCVKGAIPVGQFPAIELRHGVRKTCRKSSVYTNYYYPRNRIRVGMSWTHRSKWSFFPETILSCLKKIRQRRWSEAWRRAKAWKEA